MHAPGTVLRWSLSMGGRLGGSGELRVVADGADGTLLRLPGGATVHAATVHPRDAVPGSPPAPLVEIVTDRDALVWWPAGAAHGVWWRFTPEGAFTGWYVNLERRVVGPDGVDAHDHELDLVVAPDRTWAWKDEERFAAATGRPGFWTAEEALAIRAEGERVVDQVERAVFPFDGTWCGWGLAGPGTPP